MPGLLKTVPQRISEFNRQRKYRTFLELLAPGPQSRILDVGYTDAEFRASDNFLEKHYPHPERITALGIASPAEFLGRYPGIAVVRYGGGRFPFKDKSFDIGWSNAVLEHVGDRNAQTLFLAEIARVCQRAFITTPNRYFPIEVHTLVPFLHYLPKPRFDRLLRLLGKQWAAGDYMHLLSGRDLRQVLAAAGIVRYRLIKNRLAGCVLDFAVVW